MPKERVHFPETLPGAAEFSGHPALHGAVELIQAFKAAEAISGPLMAAAEALASPIGRRRRKGSWVLVWVGFIASRQGDIQPFHDRASREMWKACGFEGDPPCYTTTWSRLTELEALLPEIEEAIGRMIQLYSKVEPRIGRHIHIDGTEAETHSHYDHACGPDDDCAWRKEGETAEDVNQRVLGRATTESAMKYRQQEDSGAFPNSSDEAVESIVQAAGSVSRRRQLYVVKTSNHAWFTHDPEAGFRSYKRANGALEGWHGYYHLRAIDDFTGLTIYGHVASSSKAENSLYNQLLDGIVCALNEPEKRPGLDAADADLVEILRESQARLPEAITGDRGFAFPFIAEKNTRLGILTVTPWRNIGGRPLMTEVEYETRDGARVVIDRHGVIRCRHCGGPTKHVELRRAKGENPRIYVQCLLPAATDSPCGKRQSISCDLDWRMLLALPRNDERYIALEKRMQYERTHNIGRVRNRNGAKDPILRPKRLGRAWQQLQLNFGTMVDWLRAGLKHGWLNGFAGYSKRVTDQMRAAEERLKNHVSRRVEEIRLERQQAGLDTCYAPPGPEPPPPQ